MTTIHKYPISRANSQTVSMPLDAEILSVHVQRGQICLWALHGYSNHSPRTIRVIPTGDDFTPCKLKFIGTILLNQGDFVLHVFEEGD